MVEISPDQLAPLSPRRPYPVVDGYDLRGQRFIPHLCDMAADYARTGENTMNNGIYKLYGRHRFVVGDASTEAVVEVLVEMAYQSAQAGRLVARASVGQEVPATREERARYGCDEVVMLVDFDYSDDPLKVAIIKLLANTIALNQPGFVPAEALRRKSRADRPRTWFPGDAKRDILPSAVPR